MSRGFPWIVVFAFFLPQSSWACDLGGKFSQAVLTTVGERARAQASFAMAVLDARSGEVLCQDSLEPARNVYPASTIKTLVAMAVLLKVDRGEARLDDLVTMDQVNAGTECRFSSCEVYGPGKRIRLQRLLRDMIVVSNNLATNQLIDLASKAFINQVADRIGAQGLRVVRKVYDEVNPEPQITERSRATAAGFVALYREIATGRLGILSEPSRALLVEWLYGQQINGSLNRNFPASVRFHHKTGNTSDSSGDAGFYYLGDDRVVILAGLQAFKSFETLQKIGKSAYDLSLALR
jgi:beta-lactamase class A